jgi:dTDP-4-amino-4,6-dideoxygalactose transaminase
MIPFLDLPAQTRSIRAELEQAIARVLDSGQFVLGEAVSAFESAFAREHGCAHGVGVNSGTSALHLALLAAGVGPGDEVVTVPFTFVATAAAVGYAGARAVLVDVDPLTRTMAPDLLERAITPRTKAVLPVHLHGHPADMDPILEVSRRHGLVVIEDAAQAHLASYKGRPVGAPGDMACFSFYPGKNLGACGEAGLVTTNDERCARAIRRLRDWGQERKYHHVERGFNYRMEGLQGAVLGVKLRHLPAWTEARRRHAARYNRLLAGSPLETPTEAEWARAVSHVYAVRTGRRDELQAWLAARQIQTGVHYPVPVHLQPAYADLGYRRGDFPVSEALADSVLSLPMYPELTGQQVETVAEAVLAFGGSRQAA